MPPKAAEAPDLSGLVELSRDRQLDLKPIVLRVQTDLFLAAPVRDRSVLAAFESLANGLVPIVDEDTALIVARKLGPCPDTPASVRESLAARGGAIAEAVRLPEPQPTDPESDQPAEGTPLAEIALDAAPQPSETGEGTRRPRAELLTRLLTFARRDVELAKDLLARADLADAEIAPLWLHADTYRRLLIQDALNATASLRPCPPAQRDLGKRLCVLSSARDVGAFARGLSDALGLPPDFLKAAPDAGARYDLITLAMRAADLRESEAVHVFLTLNETVARSVERVFGLRDLFRSMSRATARDLVSAILDVTLPDRPAGTHQAYHGPEAQRPRGFGAAERSLLRAGAFGQARRAG